MMTLIFLAVILTFTVVIPAVRSLREGRAIHSSRQPPASHLVDPEFLAPAQRLDHRDVHRAA